MVDEDGRPLLAKIASRRLAICDAKQLDATARHWPLMRPGCRPEPPFQRTHLTPTRHRPIKFGLRFSR
jgi:hypothetical protein